MRAQRRVSCPSNLLFFDTETKGEIDPLNPNSAKHRLWFGMLIAFRYENQQMTRYIEKRFTTVEQFWSIVDGRIDPSRPLYMFALNLGFDLTIVDFWRYSEERGFRIEFAVLDDPPTAICFSYNDCRVYAVDTLNYWRVSLAKLAESVGMTKLTMPDYKASKAEWNRYCIHDVKPLAKAITNLFDFLIDNDLGNFAISAPAIAMNCFKYKFMGDTKVFVHDNKRVLDLERDSYYGGLVHNFFIGKVKGKVYHYDVNSLYPFVMQNPMPVKLLDKVASPKLSFLRLLMRKHGVAAQVLIDSKTEVFPIKRNDKLMEVKGRFITSLCGPELKRAIDTNSVKECYFAAWYDMADIFTDYVQFFWRMRQECKAKGDDVGNTFAKLMMNSLYGKFGQRGYEWRDLTFDNFSLYCDTVHQPLASEYNPDNFMPTINWRQNKWFPLGHTKPITVRAFGGKTQLKFPAGEHYESSPIVSGFVTAYAREYLRMLIRVVGKTNIYYCDTDSLFVSKCGSDRLRAKQLVNGNLLGMLKLEGTAKNPEFNCPKDYSFGNLVKRKGIRGDAIAIGQSEFLQNQFEGIRSVLKREPEPFIRISWIVKQNTRTFTKGIVRPNGIVDYINLEDF